MDPKESKIFLTFLWVSALLWALIGAWLFGPDPAAQRAYFRVFQWIILDLGALIFMFWRVFFAVNRNAFWKFQIMVSFTFKLVCLGFLAITLKELRNEPHLPAISGVLFLVVGPLVSAIAARVYGEIKDRKRGTRV
jgi:hypothetical protein